MGKSLTRRVGRILSGSLNGIIDTLESMAPAMVMDQTVREVDQAIEDVRAELGRVISIRHLATNRLVEENHKHEELLLKIHLALQKNREELARAAISKQLDIEAQILALEDAITQGKTAEDELTRYIQTLEGRRSEMKDELRQFRKSTCKTDAYDEYGHQPRAIGKIKIEDAVRSAESAFERIMPMARGLATTGRIDLDVSQKLLELDSISRNHSVNKRMARFRSIKQG